ncbi:hypothetical protein GQR58_022514 [Nymphon striatum]|nr:hypothetical protein GQR58_022514 [Nymphon striatum]
MLREMDGGLVLGCDGRADSPGHSDKSPTHNEVANSGQMEKEGLMCAVSKKQDAELPIHCRQTENAVLMPKVTQYQMGTIFVMTFALSMYKKIRSIGYRKFSINCYSFYSFQSMNIASISASTFNNHLSKFLVPTVMHTWQDEQKKYFKKLREMDGGLVLGCDGRADSPGHSDKYSGQMEKEELMRAVSKLQDAELPIHWLEVRTPLREKRSSWRSTNPYLVKESTFVAIKSMAIGCLVEYKDGTSKCFMVKVPDRKRTTLEAEIQRFILPGSHILSDGWAVYARIDQINDGIYTDEVITHNENFVHPDDSEIHTQNIEGMWSHAKHKLRYTHGTSELLLSAFDSSIGYRKFSIHFYSFYSFQSMNIASISASTFNNHLSKFLVPTVMHTWQDKQKKYFKMLREMDGGLVLGCDGRADSPGHSDKNFESGSCIAKVASFRESGHSPSPITFISVPLYVRGLETSLSRFGGPFSIMWLTYMNDMGTSFKELTEASLNLVTMYLRIFSSNFTIPFSTRIYNIVVKFGVNPPVLNKNA